MRMPIQFIATGIVAALLGITAAPAIATEMTEGTLSQLGTTVCNGTVMSMYPTHIVVACRHKGKTAPLDFVLNGVTLRKGEIAVGTQVIVHYRTVNGRNFAMSIQRRSPSPDSNSL